MTIIPGIATSFRAPERSRLRVLGPESGGFLAPWLKLIKLWARQGKSPAKIAWKLSKRVDRYYKWKGEPGARVSSAEIEVVLWHARYGYLPPAPKGLLIPDLPHPLEMYLGQIVRMFEKKVAPAAVATWVHWHYANSRGFTADQDRVRRIGPVRLPAVERVYRYIAAWKAGSRLPPQPTAPPPRLVLREEPGKQAPRHIVRNREIMRLRCLGFTHARIAELFDLSATRVWQICWRFGERRGVPTKGLLLSDLDLYYSALDGIAAELEARAAGDKVARRRLLLDRPYDMGGPRGVWLGEDIYA